MTEFAISSLDMADLDDCLDLAASRDWAREREKWRFLLAHGQGFGLRDERERLVGSVMLTRYGTTLAVIGMLLVHPSHGGRGLGLRLMDFALEQARPASVYLYATEEGRPLYERLGFKVMETVSTYRGLLRPSAPVGAIFPLTLADLPRVLAFDQFVFGADRAGILSGLLRIADRACLVEQAGKILGFGFAWQNLDTLHLEPVVAQSDDIAQQVIAYLAASQPLPVRVDISAQHERLAAWFIEQGLVRVDETPLMVWGGEMLPGHRRDLYTIPMQAIG